MLKVDSLLIVGDAAHCRHLSIEIGRMPQAIRSCSLVTPSRVPLVATRPFEEWLPQSFCLVKLFSGESMETRNDPRHPQKRMNRFVKGVRRSVRVLFVTYVVTIRLVGA